MGPPKIILFKNYTYTGRYMSNRAVDFLPAYPRVAGSYYPRG